AGSTSLKKCWPSTSMSLLTASWKPCDTGSNAQSSPTPSMPVGAGHEKYRAIRANSLSGRTASPIVSAPRGSRDLGGARPCRQFVHHAVDEANPVGATERHGQFDGLVDGGTI